MAGLDRSDVDLCSFYDCFTITVLATLEDTGFAPKGQGGAWVAERDLSFAGDFPLNTHGGQLGMGQGGAAAASPSDRRADPAAGARGGSPALPTRA